MNREFGSEVSPRESSSQFAGVHVLFAILSTLYSITQQPRSRELFTHALFADRVRSRPRGSLAIANAYRTSRSGRLGQAKASSRLTKDTDVTHPVCCAQAFSRCHDQLPAIDNSRCLLSRTTACPVAIYTWLIHLRSRSSHG